MRNCIWSIAAARAAAWAAARLFSYLMALNPVDSRTLAAAILDPRAGTQDLWLMDLTKDSIAPLTTTRGFAGNPVWSADGRRLAYAYQPPGQLDDVYIKDIGTGLIQPVIETPSDSRAPARLVPRRKVPARLLLR